MTIKLQFHNLGGNVKPWLRRYQVSLMDGERVVKTVVLAEDDIRDWVVKEL